MVITMASAQVTSTATTWIQSWPGLPYEQAVAARIVDQLGGEEPGGQRAPGAAHAVHADHVERVVVRRAST